MLLTEMKDDELLKLVALMSTLRPRNEDVLRRVRRPKDG